MKIPQLNERVLALCALITKEEDPGRFHLLVEELNGVFENGEREVGYARSTTTHRGSKVISISPRA
jgi:hypothetical protein